MDLRGKLVAGAAVSGGDPVGSYAESSEAPEYLTNIYGGADVDFIFFGDETGIAGGTTWGDPGYVFIGAKTRVYAGDSEDQLRVWTAKVRPTTTRSTPWAARVTSVTTSSTFWIPANQTTVWTNW